MTGETNGWANQLTDQPTTEGPKLRDVVVKKVLAPPCSLHPLTNFFTWGSGRYLGPIQMASPWRFLNFHLEHLEHLEHLGVKEIEKKIFPNLIFFQ